MYNHLKKTKNTSALGQSLVNKKDQAKAEKEKKLGS